jgi:hypothetical protein
VSLVTWNLAEESPSDEDASFMKRFRGMKKNVQSFPRRDAGKTKASERKAIDKLKSGSDIVLISAQECENIKPRRTEGQRSREYRRLMIRMLGKNYVPLALHLLGGIQLGLFCKRQILSEIEHVSIADVTCGIGNVFHNKGGIGAFVQLRARATNFKNKGAIVKSSDRAKSIRMLFVTAHMAAHVQNSDARDSDFWRIVSELELQAPEGFLNVQQQSTQVGESDQRAGSLLLDSMDYVFFCGDLNYRMDLPRESVESSVSQICRLKQNIENNRDRNIQLTSKSELVNVVQQLLKYDQLKTSIISGKAFPGFSEGCITFPPTFKYDKHTDHYDTSHKQRIPAWTDRILFKSSSFAATREAGTVGVVEYDSIQTATHSDHRPVFGTFRISTLGQVIEQTPMKKKKSKKTAAKKKPIVTIEGKVSSTMTKNIVNSSKSIVRAKLPPMKRKKKKTKQSRQL